MGGLYGGSQPSKQTSVSPPPMTKAQAQNIWSNYLATQPSHSAQAQTVASPSAQPESDAPGLGAGDYLGLAKTGLNFANQAGSLTGIGTIPGGGVAGSLLGLGADILGGKDPMKTGMDAGQTGLEGLKLADKLGWLGGAAGEIGAGADALAGGLGAGGLGALEGTTFGSLGADALASGLGAGGLMGAEASPLLTEGGAALASGLSGGLEGAAVGSGAGAAATGAATGLSSVLGAAAIPLFFIGLGLNNVMAQKQQEKINQTKESVNMRRGAQQGLQTLGQTANLTQALPYAPTQALPSVLDKYREALNQWPAVQQTIGNRGQGGHVSMTKPLDQGTLDTMTNAFYPALRQSEAGYLWAMDQAARNGQPMPDWAQGSFGQTDPAAIMNNLSRGYMGNQDMGINAGKIDYSQAVPGNLVNFFKQQTATDPRLQAAFNALPAETGTAPSIEQMAQANAARQAQAQAVVAANSVNQGYGNGIDVNALAYASPYLPGGLQQSLTQTFNATPDEQSMIADLLSRGADPVGIRSAIMASREQQQQAGNTAGGG